MSAGAEGVALRAVGVERRFRTPLGRSVAALRGVDLEARAGEVVGLVGPNGSGKTTLLRCALGLLATHGGEVSLFGARPARAVSQRRVGYAPERFEPAPRRTGLETVALLAELSGFARREARGLAKRSLERLGLASAAHRRVGGYSKGMRRRLALAQAVLGDPDLLVLDEPFDGLDPLGVRDVQRLVREAAERGAAVVLSSHALADLEAVATHLVVLSRGRVAAAGTLLDVAGRGGAVEIEVEGLTADALRALEGRVAELGGRVTASRPAGRALVSLLLEAGAEDDRGEET